MLAAGCGAAVVALPPPAPVRKNRLGRAEEIGEQIIVFRRAGIRRLEFLDHAAQLTINFPLLDAVTGARNLRDSAA